MYLHTKSELSRSKLSKATALQRHTQTNATENITIYHAASMSGKNATLTVVHLEDLP